MAAATPTPVSATTAVPTAIERYFQISLFLLIVTGFATLASTGKLDLPSVLCVSLALLVRARQLFRNDAVKIPERITSYLGLIYVAFYLADFFLLSQNFVAATVHLLLFGMVTKIFSVQRDRDYIYLAVLAFLEVLSASVLTVDTVFLGAFSLFLLVAVATFISMEMRRSAMAAGNTQHIPSAPKRLRGWQLRSLDLSLSATSAAMVLGILVLSAAIFFVMPRLSGGYLGRFAQQNSLTTGFSDNVQLGEIGRIQQSSQVVMHVRIEDGKSVPEVRMRGIALSTFDGTRWFNPPHNLEFLSHRSGRYDVSSGVSGFSRPSTRFASGSAHHVEQYRVMMEPIGTNVVFLIAAPKFLFADFREVTVDFGQSVMNTDRERATNSYTGISDVSQPAPDGLRNSSADYDTEISRQYLQVPDLDPRVKKLADDITANQSNSYDKALAVERYLSTNFEYTLELPSERPKDPLAFFLLQRKKGHCEYFASALAVLLRAEGIPTRIVTGFRGGEFNDLTGDYIIRARDAHSWVEVFFPGHGWVTFDPTPAGAALEDSAWSRFMLYTDAAREFWREWIINYDFSHQRTLTEEAASSGRQHVDQLRIWFRAKYDNMLEWARGTHRLATRSPMRFSTITIALACAMLLLMNIGRIYRAILIRRIALNPARSPSHAASIWYERMTRRLSRRGFPRKPSHTPKEFATSIENPEVREAVERFNGHYERARFGESVEDATRLPEIYKEVVDKS